MKANYRQITLKEAQGKLDELCNAAATNRDVIIIKRTKDPDVALIAADELSALIETLHLLRSPKNALRVLGALKRIQRR